MRPHWDEDRRAAIDRRARAAAPAHLRHVAEGLAGAAEEAVDSWITVRRTRCHVARLERLNTRLSFRARMRCMSASLAIYEVLFAALENADAAAIAGSPGAFASLDSARSRCPTWAPYEQPAWVALEGAAVRSRLSSDRDALEVAAAGVDGIRVSDRRLRRFRVQLVAEAALRGGDLERAAAELATIDDDLEDPALVALRLRLYLARADNGGAEALARRVLADLLKPRSIVSFVDLEPLPLAAHALRRVGDLEAAEQLVRRVNTTHDDSRAAADLDAERGRVAQLVFVGDLEPEQLRAALERRVALDGPQHPETARILHLLGAAYEATARLDLARLYYERALGIRVRALGDHPETADTYNNLGNLAFRTGDYAEARERHAAARRIRVEVFGEDHPATATSDNNIGMVLLAEGDPDAALARFTRVIAIREATLGPEHPNTAIARNNAGLARAALGDVDGALAEHRQALAIRRAFFGDDHLETARSHHNIGALLLERGDLAGARPHIEVALRTRRSQLPPEHPELRSSAELALRLERASRPLDDAGWSL
ncbi:MAG: tetratricopeptide repeat protein [Myxococcales bacterium]|nr:tetratricopeptide repeat protein [Myxococcales bacterium]